MAASGKKVCALRLFGFSSSSTKENMEIRKELKQDTKEREDGRRFLGWQKSKM